MSVVFEVVSEHQFGRKLWLRSGQVAVIGRTYSADFPIPDDGRMSRTHVELRCEEGACRIRDLKSLNGTFVNGVQVTEMMLHDGDRVLVGNTELAVHIEGGAVRKVAEPVTAADPRQAFPFRPATLLHTVGNWGFRVVPPGWEAVAGQGLRRTSDGTLPCFLTVTESCLPEGLGFDEYAKTLASQAAKGIPGVKQDDFVPRTIEGADEGLETCFYHPKSCDLSCQQRIVCARAGTSIGIAMLVALLPDASNAQPEFVDIFSGLTFGLTQPAPQSDKSTLKLTTNAIKNAER